jgi:hypothetical protein
VEHKTRRRKRVIRIVLGVAVAVTAVLVVLLLPRPGWDKSISGAVLIANADPRKQLPVPNVEVTAEAGGTTARTRSDASGFFHMQWRAPVWPSEQVTLRFRDPDHQPLDITRALSDQLYIARIQPSGAGNDAPLQTPEIVLGDLRIRYAVKGTSTVNIGSTVKTFEIANAGDVRCAGQRPCSPDGKWKAAIGSLSLDAGENHEFQNVRVSCISGPCPFTKIDTDDFSRGGRRIGASIRAWSDTVTFLAEADVVETIQTDSVRQTYPSIFGRGMTFTLPPAGQGVSIEAEVDGLHIVYPLGPDLRLSWAACSVQVAPNRTRLYRCELRPGYRFR